MNECTYVIKSSNSKNLPITNEQTVTLIWFYEIYIDGQNLQGNQEKKMINLAAEDNFTSL